MQRHDAAFLYVLLPVLQELVELLGVGFREIVNLASVFAKVVELPFVRTLGSGDEDGFPVACANGCSTAEFPT